MAPPDPAIDELSTIYIRAAVNGQWGSYSLRELLTNGHSGQIGRWFIEQCLQAVGLREGDVVTEAQTNRIVTFIEDLLHDLVRLKDPQ